MDLLIVVSLFPVNPSVVPALFHPQQMFCFGQALLRAAHTHRYQGEIRSFESPAALFRIFSPVRWTLIERLQKLGPVGLRTLARSLERDVKSVHRDVKILIEEEFIERDEAGRIHVPFDRIHAEFEMARAAA